MNEFDLSVSNVNLCYSVHHDVEWTNVLSYEILQKESHVSS